MPPRPSPRLPCRSTQLTSNRPAGGLAPLAACLGGLALAGCQGPAPPAGTPPADPPSGAIRPGVPIFTPARKKRT